MRYLKLEEILRLHFQVVKDYGGSHGVRDEERLLSAVEAPKQRAFGVEQYLSVWLKAAVYIHNLILDHPFVDGNKRAGVVCAGIFLGRNGYKFTAEPKALENYAVSIAADKLSTEEIAAWLKLNSKKIG